jgi:hypothetical protein
VIESDNSLLITVPAAAPTTATKIVVGSKNGSATTTGSFTRTTGYANFDSDDATILTGTTATFDGDSSSSPTSPYPVWYLWNIAKASNQIMIQVAGATLDPALETYKEVTGSSLPSDIVGPDGVTMFRPYVYTLLNNAIPTPATPSVVSRLSTSTTTDDTEILIRVSGEPQTKTPLTFYGPFRGNFLAVPAP